MEREKTIVYHTSYTAGRSEYKKGPNEAVCYMLYKDFDKKLNKQFDNVVVLCEEKGE